MLEFYFAVSAPIYYKMWFWFLLAFLFGGLTYWIVKKRIHQIKAKANEVAEKLRLEKDLNNLTNNLNKIELKLNNKSFIEKAPAEIIQSNFNKQKYFQKEINSLKELIECLSN